MKPSAVLVRLLVVGTNCLTHGAGKRVRAKSDYEERIAIGALMRV
jgi:hypothetical protein